MTFRQKVAFQNAFFRLVGENVRAMKEMLDVQPDVCFYIKDHESRIVTLNRRNCEICNIKDEFEAIGLRSTVLFPPQQAASYMEDDFKVLKTGKPLIDGCNIFPVDNSTNFAYKSVYPIKRPKGEIVGTMCLYRLVDNPQVAPYRHSIVSKVTRFITEHYAESLTLSSVAAVVNLSESTLTRLFLATFGTTPVKYTIKARLSAARKLLESSPKSITEIAQETGFFDHSHFCKAFTAERDLTPSEYRRRHKEIGSKPSSTFNKKNE